jgi:hypothetical protein
MMRAAVVSAVLLASAPSCPDLYSLATHGFSLPTVATTGANAVADPPGVRVTVGLSATNPNPFAITLTSVDFALSLAGSQSSPAPRAASPSTPLAAARSRSAAWLS